MGQSYALGFRHQVLQRVRRGRSIRAVADEVGASEATGVRWVAPDQVDRGERPRQPSRKRFVVKRLGGMLRDSRWRGSDLGPVVQGLLTEHAPRGWKPQVGADQLRMLRQAALGGVRQEASNQAFLLETGDAGGLEQAVLG